MHTVPYIASFDKTLSDLQIAGARQRLAYVFGRNLRAK